MATAAVGSPVLLGCAAVTMEVKKAAAEMATVEFAVESEATTAVEAAWATCLMRENRGAPC